MISGTSRVVCHPLCTSCTFVYFLVGPIYKRNEPQQFPHVSVDQWFNKCQKSVFVQMDILWLTAGEVLRALPISLVDSQLLLNNWQPIRPDPEFILKVHLDSWHSAQTDSLTVKRALSRRRFFFSPIRFGIGTLSHKAIHVWTDINDHTESFGWDFYGRAKDKNQGQNIRTFRTRMTQVGHIFS